MRLVLLLVLLIVLVPTFYVDGAAAGGGTSGAAIPFANAPLNIGFLETGFGYTGKLDEFALYNRALSGAEVVGIAAIPESSTYAMFASAATLVLAAWRRRSARHATVIATAAPT